MDQLERRERIQLFKTPLPTPTATAVAPVASPTRIASSGIEQIICMAAVKYNVDCGWLLRVANCESHLNPYAKNPSGASGLYQFMPSTFYAHGGHDLWSAYDQADVAARMFSQGLSSAWVCR